MDFTLDEIKVCIYLIIGIGSILCVLTAVLWWRLRGK